MPPGTRLPSGLRPVSPAVNRTRAGFTLTPGMKPRPRSTGRSARMSRRSMSFLLVAQRGVVAGPDGAARSAGVGDTAPAPPHRQRARRCAPDRPSTRRNAMIEDRQGNRLSGATASAAADYDRALAEFNLYRADPVGTVDGALV